MSLDAYQDLLDEQPEGTMPECGVRVLAYIRPNGERTFSVKADGVQNRGETVGMLFAAAHMYAAEMMEDHGP